MTTSRIRVAAVALLLGVVGCTIQDRLRLVLVTEGRRALVAPSSQPASRPGGWASGWPPGTR